MWPTILRAEADEAPDPGIGAPPADDPPVPDGGKPSTELDINEIVDSDLGDEDVHTATKPQVAVKPPSDAKPVAPAAATPPATQTPASATPVPPVAPPQPVPPVAQTPAVQPAAPTPSPAPPADAPVDFAGLRKQQVDRLTQAYALGAEDARLLLIEPDKVMPKLAAQLHLDVFEATFNALVNALPRLMDSHAQARTNREEAKNEFYTEFPVLKDPRYDAAVETAVMMYKQMNPGATRAQAIAASGVQVCIANQLPLPEKYMQGLVAAAPQAPAPAPFTPAGPGASGVPPATGPQNYFAKIAEEDVQDRS